MHSLIRRNEIWVFLAALVTVNAVFVNAVVYEFLPKSLYGYGRFALLGGVLFGLVFLSRGWAGVLDILRPMIEWRRSLWLYLFALCWTVLLCMVVLTGKGLLTGDYLTKAAMTDGFAKLANSQMLLTLLVSSFVGEIVWVSYAVRSLSKQFTHFVSGMIVGCIWVAWWLPMSIHNFGIIPDLPLGALLFNQMGIAAMCAFVYFHTRSGLLVLVMQLVFNATILVFPITPAIGGPATYWAFALTYFTAALVLFIVFGPRPLLRRESNQAPGEIESSPVPS